MRPRRILGASHRSAVVFIPPEDFHDPIQRIRRRFDRKVGRWMPHVTLLYPFVPEERFEEIVEPLAGAAACVEPFRARFAKLRWFEHGPGRRTYWLAPEPEERFRALHAALLGAFPDYDDTARHPDGFTPHLSVGQARGERGARELESFVEREFQPLDEVPVEEIALIRRGRDTPFTVHARFRLGADDGGDRTATSRGQGRSNRRT